MEMNIGKELDNERRTDGFLKVEQGAPSTYINGADKALTLRHPTGEHSCCCTQKKAVDDCRNNTGPCSPKTILRGYQNFMKSGLPKRFLFFENGDWKDFQSSFLNTVKVEFRSKKAMTEVTFDGQQVLLDFVHMIYINSVTGHHKPVAWIDDQDRCFFPEVYSQLYAENGYFYADGEKGARLSCEANGTLKFKVQDLSVSAAGSSNSGQPNKGVTCKKGVEENSAAGGPKVHVDLNETIGENEPCPLSPTKIADFGPLQDKLMNPNTTPNVYNALQNMLLVGLGELVEAKNIVGIFKIPLKNNSGKDRFQAFQTQVELTGNCRGNANVRYAWLASSKETVEDIMLRGVMSIKRPALAPRYGGGILFAPAHYSNVCASYADIDEKGILYMILCRLVMGNVELVRVGSEQFQPSCERFDSAADDFQNPKHYVVWDRNKETHIYPEYIVSFNMPPKTKESLVSREESLSNESGVTNSSPTLFQVGNCEPPLPTAMQSLDHVRACGRAPKAPTSPWMPFSMLFAAISKKVSSQDMDAINIHYVEFKKGKMNRAVLVKKLRQIVGDKLLISTIMRLQHKLPPIARQELPKSWCKGPQSGGC